MAVDRSFDLGRYIRPDNDRTEVLLFSWVEAIAY